MTELLCHAESYVQECGATVVAVDAATRAVVLDRTAFYPGGGGQPHDLQSKGKNHKCIYLAVEA
jgi:misacylated tRNA(Ala) deacylase